MNKKIIIVGPPRTGTSMLFTQIAEHHCKRLNSDDDVSNNGWKNALFEPLNHGRCMINNILFDGDSRFEDNLDYKKRSDQIWKDNLLIKHIVNRQGSNITVLDTLMHSANIIITTARNFPDWAVSMHLADITRQFSNIDYRKIIKKPVIITEDRIIDLFNAWLHTSTMTNNIINRYSTTNLWSIEKSTNRFVLPFNDNQFNKEYVNYALNKLKISDKSNIDFKPYTKKQLTCDPSKLIKNYDAFLNLSTNLEISSKFTFTTNWVFNKPNIWESISPYIKNKPCHFCEIGSYEGRSTIWFINNFCNVEGSSMTCIDIKMRPNLLKNLSNINTKKIEINLINQKLDPQYIFKNKLDCCYIDGDHSYEGTLHDIKNIWDNIAYNGFVIFDDYDQIEIQEAVKNFLLSVSNAKIFNVNDNTCIIRKTNKY